MDPLFELAIILPPRGSRHLLVSLHAQLRAAILDGRLQPGLKLPASRALARTLQLSRNTVVAAYDLLLSEGYLAGRAGSGTYVAESSQHRRRAKPPAPAGTAGRRLAPFWRAPGGPMPTLRSLHRFDFRLGLPDSMEFPFDIWRRLSARALRILSKAPASYGEPQGRQSLRQAIASHVSFTRAVACGAEDIVVTNGAQQAFDLLARILVVPGRTAVAVEEPGYPPLRRAFAAAGADILGVGVDDEGPIIDRLAERARIVCVTPSHQFPLGCAMSRRRRAELLDFCRRQSAVVIEDDYDGEFRYGGRPLDALQTLDRDGSVFYVGTFSKSLFPALRLGFVVAPAWARPALIAARQISDWHAMALAQDTLAAFIHEGHLARHIRKMRRIYGRRREILLQAMERHCGARLQPLASAAGLHLAARLAGSIRAETLSRRAGAFDVAVETLGRYATAKPALNGLAFGFGSIRSDAIEEGIRRLARAMD
jgi:GntR family transcriptional regulator/MocR family aminotransferase